MRAEVQAVISVWGYEAFLIEVFEEVELYLQFVAKVWGNTHFLKVQSLYKIK